MLDWTNLPQGTSAISLWTTLHDAELFSLKSDLLQRTLKMHFESEHLRSFHHLPDDFNFVLLLKGVQSARVVGYAVWPGEFSVPPGISREQESQLVEEYQSKWREQSHSWADFEASVSRENEQVLDISDATLATSEHGIVALHLCGNLNYSVYHEVFLRAETLEFSGNDGTVFDLQRFQRIGEQYWEAFEEKDRAREHHQ